MVPWLAIAAVAAPAGYVQTDTTSDGCAVYTGPKNAHDATPLLAECVWPEVTLAAVERFARFDQHDEIFSAIAASDVLRTEAGVSYVHQVHVAKGISERECVLKMTRTDEGGGVKFAWTLDPTATTVAEGRVPVTADDGYWWFVPNPGGGVKVTYTLAYAPGGSVPGFLVRWFQGSGFEAALPELRSWLARP
jgi:hypothetical protein